MAPLNGRQSMSFMWRRGGRRRRARFKEPRRYSRQRGRWEPRPLPARPFLAARRRVFTTRLHSAHGPCTCMRRSPSICHVHLLGKYLNVSYFIYYVIMSLFIIYSRNGPCSTQNCFLNIHLYNRLYRRIFKKQLYDSGALLFGSNLPNYEPLVRTNVGCWEYWELWSLIKLRIQITIIYLDVGRVELNGLLFSYRLTYLSLHVDLIPATVWKLYTVIKYLLT